jgi:nicotinamide-nucleotide amidase
MTLSAAIVTVGSELVEGLRIDTNTAEVAREIVQYGFVVEEAVSVADSAEKLSATLARLTTAYSLVVVTGGLGPTHDDITREAAAAALGLAMRDDPVLLEFLEPFLGRHADPRSRQQVLTQALVLDGAEVLAPATGTAAGQVIPTRTGNLVLLPGPPSEMRPMLASALSRFTRVRAVPRELGVTGMPESDIQHAAQEALADFADVGLTVLAKPGDVRVILFDEGAAEPKLAEAAACVATAIGDACYSTDGASLAQVVVREAAVRGVTLALAESCTGGMIAAELTNIPGASEVFLGGGVVYSNASKTALLGVDPAELALHGAVSRRTAELMATGARQRFGADICVSVTGVAGPDGGSAEKPVGTVWFGVDSKFEAGSTVQHSVDWRGASRSAIRARATARALDILRREVLRA